MPRFNAPRPVTHRRFLYLAAGLGVLWLGFHDENGRYQDNHLGRGKLHEFDPLWFRIEVVRITVD